MFPTRYFANRMYAPRYFPKVGEDGGPVTFLAAWARFANMIIFPGASR